MLLRILKRRVDLPESTPSHHDLSDRNERVPVTMAIPHPLFP